MANPPSLFGLCAKAPVARAQPVLEALVRHQAVDPYRAVTRRGEHVLIPIRDPAAARATVDLPLVEAPVAPSPRRAPLAKVRDRLRGAVPDRLLGALPEGYDRVGDVVLLRLPEPLAPHGSRIGAAYGRVLDADTVLALGGAQGELREPETEHLWGALDTETVHHEHGLTYHLDPARVLFSVGNHHERHRLADAVEPGEQVVDLFAGIGYFALPLARAGARVVACEKNPTAARYLEQNAHANALEDQVQLRLGDCREVAPEGIADRVVMGYFPGTRAFLDVAHRALAPQGGTIHYHTVTDAETAPQRAWSQIRDHPALAGTRLERAGTRSVKTVGPGRVHVVVDIDVIPDDEDPLEARG